MEPSCYGADMEGTLFGGDEACGWNVDQLENCLHLLKADEVNVAQKEDFRLPGVTTAYLYFGMWGSVFAAHTEDMNLLSINHLHAGAPKYWYAIAPEDSGRFESLMASQFSHAASTCNEFLRHKRFLLSPTLLQKAGISYTTQVQRAGDTIITFPGSYHFGFNTGFNVAESTNFAIPEWVPMGFRAKVCMCHPHSVRICMKRFMALLIQYEEDISLLSSSSSSSGSSTTLTYSEWATLKLREQKAEENKNSNETEEDTKENWTERKRKMWVEVSRLMADRNGGNGGDGLTKNGTGTVSRKGKKRKRAKEPVIKGADFRWALKPKKSALVPRKSVLVRLKSPDTGEQCFFSGVIVAVMEDHCKVHFAASSKSEDLWIPIISNRLFLDGGCET
jgi:jumonji domain-containing protein 2